MHWNHAALTECHEDFSCVFPKIDDSGTVGNKSLRREQQNNFSNIKVTSCGDWTQDPSSPLVAHLVLHFHAFLPELTWQVLREGYLTLLLLVYQLTFKLWWFNWNQQSMTLNDLKSLSFTSNIKLAQLSRHESISPRVPGSITHWS